MNRRAVLVLLAALTLASLNVRAQQGELGSIDFPTSGAAAAQPAFLKGVLLMHSFEYDDAKEAFVEAQQADPGFAMAYWGEAMTYNHAVWQQTAPDRARAALARLAPTAEGRLAKAEGKGLARFARQPVRRRRETHARPRLCGAAAPHAREVSARR